MLLSVQEKPVKRRKYSRFRFGVVLGIGAIVASVLCVQCVRTYLYTDTVLVPQQAEREAERQMGALTTAARSAAVTDSHALGPVIGQTLEAAADHVLWIRVLDAEGNVLAQGGRPQGTAKIPSRWWEKVQSHESLGALADTSEGKALVAMLPFRLPRPPHRFEAGTGGTEPPNRLPAGHGPGAYIVELAIPLRAVGGTFEGLRQNLIVGVIASIALLLSLAIIALRARDYLRGKYLESELQLARRVQSDLQPKAHPISAHVEFGAWAMAADHVGGDFYDIFESDSGKISIVLGDVSGKGVPAALLVSVLQGAIRSSTAQDHERACARINSMLCERTAGERFATLFWGVFDPATSTLRYVNAGHAAPIVIRQGESWTANEPGRFSRANMQTVLLNEGGPVLGLLPRATYSAGTINIEASDTLVLYSDGITEAANQKDEEFGDDRLLEILSDNLDSTPPELCGRVTKAVTAFASAGTAPDDRTLLVVRFPQSGSALRQRNEEEIGRTTAA